MQSTSKIPMLSSKRCKLATCVTYRYWPILELSGNRSLDQLLYVQHNDPLSSSARLLPAYGMEPRAIDQDRLQSSSSTSIDHVVQEANSRISCAGLTSMEQLAVDVSPHSRRERWTSAQIALQIATDGFQELRFHEHRLMGIRA